MARATPVSPLESWLPRAIGAVCLLGCSSSPPAPAQQAPIPTVVASTASASPSATPSASASAQVEVPRTEGGLVAVVRRRRAPSVKVVSVKVDSDTDAAAIQAALEARLVPLRTCYLEALAKTPRLAGELPLDITLGSGGQAKRVDVPTTLQDDGLRSCVSTIAKETLYPAPKRAGTVAHVAIELLPGDAPPSTIGGKPTGKVTQADLEKALTDAGASGIAVTPAKGYSVVRLDWQGAALTITFAPRGTSPLPATEVDRLRLGAQIFAEGRLYLAIEGEPERARALIEAIVKKPE